MMKIFKYSSTHAIKACFAGGLLFAIGISCFKILPVFRDFITAFAVILAISLGIVSFIFQGIMKFGKKAGVGKEGIVLLNGLLVPWHKIEAVKAEAVVKSWNLRRGTTTTKYIKIRYIDELRGKIIEARIPQYIEHYEEFKKLVTEQFAKHKKAESEETKGLKNEMS